MKDQERFVCIYKQGKAKRTEIWVDTRTGVNYVFLRQGLAAGMSPMLDSEGKPVISKEYIRKQ